MIHLSFGQDVFNKNYTIKDGLSSQTVYCAEQDNQGFMWFGTDAGVCRFDGKNFRLFTTNEGLPDNEILKMNKDSKGRIWFMSLNGILSYYYNDTIFNNENDSRLNKARADNGIITFLEDSRHNLWFGTLGSQVLCITETDGMVYDIPLVKMDSVIPSGWVFLHEPAPGRIWVESIGQIYELKNKTFTLLQSQLSHIISNVKTFFWENTGAQNTVIVINSGIYELNGENLKLIISADSTPRHLRENVYMVTVNPNKDIWLSTSGKQTLYFRRNGNTYDPGTVFLSGILVGRVFTDNEKNNWLCTIGNGVFKVSPRDPHIKIYAHYNTVSKPQVLCVTIDPAKNVWFGLSNGTVTCLANGIETNYILLKNENINRVLHLVSDSAGNIFCAADGGLFLIRKLKDGNFAQPIKIQSRVFLGGSFKYLCFSRNGQLLAGRPGGIVIYTPLKNGDYIDSLNPLLPLKRCYAMHFDYENNLWFENSEQLFSFDGKKLTPFPGSAREFGVKISDIDETPDSVLVISTFGNGIRFIKQGKIIGRFTAADGMVSNLCRRVFCRGNYIYVSTSRGFSSFKYEKGKVSNIENFSSRDGIISDDIHDIVSDSGNTYLATSEGLCVVSKNFKKDVSAPPPVYFMSVYSGNSVIKFMNGNFTLSYNQQNLHVHYIALTYERPDQVVYQYRLNENSDWEETSNANIQFSSLNPGSYRFELRARKFNSGWSNPSLLTFTITPPFWQTTWFRMLAALALLSLIFAVFRIIMLRRYRVRFQMLKQQESLIAERNRIAADVHDDIGADLSNLLLLARITKNSHTINDTDKIQVSRIENAASLVISKMDEIIWSLNPVNDKLVNVIYFIERYAEDFLNTCRIEHSIVLPELIPDFFIHAADRRNIFLSVKELLNNIYKHSGATSVRISFRVENSRNLEIMISDNGKGFDPGSIKSGGRGLNNIRKRITNLKGTISFRDTTDRGVTVSLVIPLK